MHLEYAFDEVVRFHRGNLDCNFNLCFLFVVNFEFDLVEILITLKASN